MRNTLQDLNGYLFEALERLNDEDLSQEELEKEIKRTESITKVSEKIIDNANLVLKAETFKQEYGIKTNDSILNKIMGETNK